MRSKSSRRWLREHFSDPYVKKAHQEGLRSRAAFKLQEIQERDKLFQSGMNIIDLGASPGGWSERMVQWVGKKNRVIALDILPMEPIDGVEFLQGDFNDDTFLQKIHQRFENTQVDWVVSDLSPNISGINSVDQPLSMAFAERALEFAVGIDTGGLLVKVFQGEGFDTFLMEVRRHFKKVLIRKPKASRDRSREVYILAKIAVKSKSTQSSKSF